MSETLSPAVRRHEEGPRARPPNDRRDRPVALPPAQAISVVGRGEQGLLVQTADGVREPQNRRVEIVIQ